MNPNLTPKVISRIDSLCLAGCSQVNDILSKAKNGQAIKELSDLNSTEIEQVIEELEQIMSVYDSKDEDVQTDHKPAIK